MTQPQYYDPNAPGGYSYQTPTQQAQYGAPQGYAQASPNPYGPPPQQYGQAGPPNMYGPPPGQQGYGQYQQYPPQQGPPQQDLSGDLDSFYAQRSVGGGKGISWKGVPDGFTVLGVVARPITNGDVFKETYPPNSPQAGQLRTNRDGSPKYAMQVPLKLISPLPGHEDGEGRLFLRGGLRDEMTRAMAEVGAPVGPPEAGAFVRVTLTHRKPSNNIAQNMFAVVYRSPGTWENDPTILQQQIQHTAPSTYYNPQQAPQQAPYQQQAPAQYAAPAQAYPNPQQAPVQAAPQGYGPQPGADPNQYAQPQYGQQAYDPNQGQPSAFTQMAAAQGAIPNPQQMQAQYAQNMQGQPAPNTQYAQQGQPQAPNTQAPAGAVNPGDQAALPGMPNPNQPPVQNGVQPSGLDPAKQALLARVTGQGQPAGAPQQ